MSATMKLHKSTRTALDTMPTHHDNQALFKQLENADYHLAQLSRNREANQAEVRYWEREYNSSRTQLILANQGLVGSIARKYAGISLDFHELVSEGNIGLMKAIDKFDPSRGNQFATYAYFSIKGAITRALSNQTRTIRIPEHQLAAIRTLKKISQQLWEELKSEPSVEELAWETDLSVAKVRALLSMENSTVSIDSNLDGDDGPKILDFHANSSAVDPSHEADSAMRAEWLMNAMENLTEREREVLCLRYGIKDGHACNYQEIGEEIGVSRERIRQIHNEALDKILKFHKASGYSKLVNKAKLKGDITEIAGVESNDVTTYPKVSRLKTRESGNLNHHLWINNGTWYCKFRYIDADGRTRTANNSLHTKQVEEARIGRDKMMAEYDQPPQQDAA